EQAVLLELVELLGGEIPQRAARRHGHPCGSEVPLHLVGERDVVEVPAVVQRCELLGSQPAERRVAGAEGADTGARAERAEAVQAGTEAAQAAQATTGAAVGADRPG